jgi:flavodoxin
MKPVVAYFSASGVTRAVAKTMAETVSGDLFEIRPETAYTEADLDWMDTKSRSTLEMRDEKCRPAMAETLNNPESYDTIYLGFPVWWYVAPRIINSFLESFDCTGKTFVLFGTSGSSDLKKSETALRTAYPQANWKPGKVWNQRPDTKILGKWVESVK